MTLATIGLGQLLWGLLVLFFMVQYFMLFFSVIVDVFRSHDLSGGMKALWSICLLIFPIISLLAYLVTRGGGMAQRSLREAQRTQDQFEQYVRSAAGAATPGDQIVQAKALLDAGAITATEFEALKAKALV